MSDFVVDASVAVKWVLPERHSNAASALLESDGELHAPAHWLSEAANAVWACCAIRREISHGEMRDRTAALLKVAVETTPLVDLVQEAVRISDIVHATVYDTLYLTLALRRNITLVTADGRFVDRVRAGGEPYHSAVRWLGDMPGS